MDITDHAEPTLTVKDFVAPWRDLRTRLDSAVVNLRALFRSTADTDNQVRLAWKRDAIDTALDTWQQINDNIVAGRLDHAGAWRAFTDQVAYLFSVTDVHPGFYEGIALALSYQRGYDPVIDAPPIPNPHLLVKG